MTQYQKFSNDKWSDSTLQNKILQILKSICIEGLRLNNGNSIASKHITIQMYFSNPSFRCLASSGY